MLASLSGAAASAAVHTDVMTAVKACEPEARALLQKLVQIDSGTADIPGVSAVGALLKSELQRSGAEVESVPATTAAAQQALRLGTLADPSRQTTVNVTVIEGGNASNVIPDHAVLKADVRAFTPEEFDRIEKGLQELAAHTSVPDVQVHAQLTRSFPPWPRAASTDALLARAQKLYAEIGGTLTGVVVGSSADVALAAETGTPAIDGVGIRGGGAHGPEDYADLSSIVPRVYLLSRMLMDLGRDPTLAIRKD